jgi:hypothetical protein
MKRFKLTTLLMAPPGASADDAVPAAELSAPARPFKLTLGDYFYNDAGEHHAGQDINLRYRRDGTSVWAGYYHDPVFGGQSRAGFDTSWQPLSTLDFALLPSVQVASQNFLGGSLTAQAGSTWFAQIGIGRTNLRPYQNLNFDPNDAVTVAIGHHGDDGSSYSLSTIKDDRLHTGQRHTHAVMQLALPQGQRLTLDLLRKTGNGDSGHVAAWGATVTYDFPAWFVRAAHDPKQNFGTADATRLSIGMRF